MLSEFKRGPPAVQPAQVSLRSSIFCYCFLAAVMVVGSTAMATRSKQGSPFCQRCKQLNVGVRPVAHDKVR